MIQVMINQWVVPANVRQILGPLKFPKAWPNMNGKMEHIFKIKRHL